MPFLNWKRTSLNHLSTLEEKIFSCLPEKPNCRYIQLSGNNSYDKNDTNLPTTSYDNNESGVQLWTISLNEKSKNIPLVLLHGMGSGVGLWVLNLESLSENRCVHAIDLLGFGRSTRKKFAMDARMVEREFTDSIEKWRLAMKLDKFILLGHSLGGFLATSYSLQHPERIERLILADTWGFSEKPDDIEINKRIPLWARLIKAINEPFNPFALIRLAGPWGPSLIAKYRADIMNRYAHLYPEMDTRITDYIYHCNAQQPCGESAFKELMMAYGWAKNPMIQRIDQLDRKIPITMIHGEKSWVDYNIAYEVKSILETSVDIEIIKEASHHVYADNPKIFNSIVNKACLQHDKNVSTNKNQNQKLSQKQNSASTDKKESVETSFEENFRNFAFHQTSVPEFKMNMND